VTTQNTANLPSLVTVEWLSTHLQEPDIRVIEVIGLNEDGIQAYNDGHVPDASAWQWQEMFWDARTRDFPGPQEFARRLGTAGISNETRIILYGEDVQFGVFGWWALRYCGHERVSVLDGGRRNWVAGGHPLQRQPSPAPASIVYQPVNRNPTMRAFRDDMIRVIDDGKTSIVDARSAEEYNGVRVGVPGGPDTGALRAGRIPHAKHLFFSDLVDNRAAFKTRAELEALTREVGLSPSDPVVSYCRMGHRATMVYFALHEILGYTNVKVYDGSWTEWGNLVGVPIER
jgi:thiosulfate/3-mercaptopyruvate sulfurtransferase